MQFTQLEFILLFPVVTISLYFINNSTIKKVILLISSMYFYAYFDYRLLALLLISSISTYFFGKWIQSTNIKANRKKYLLIGLVVNISILIIFKYLTFFLDSIHHIVGKNDISSINIIIPLGISFYIFRFIGYLVDMYNKKDKNGSLLDFLVYGTFFPIIVSGPISRARTFIPQISIIQISKDKLYSGFKLFVIGLFLKVFVADRIAPYVNYFYENYNVFDITTSWLAVLSYSIQIYCDFAGYSSMAIGLSLMLGIHIEENFNFPYLSQSIIEFWGRWHITLSSWIKDYLYVPLGGNRRGKRRKYLNLLLAMSLCGLWHGASWTFVVWGFIHGLLLVINHSWRDSRFVAIRHRFPMIYGLLSLSLTFVTVTVCWVFFRSTDLDQAINIVLKLFTFTDSGVTWIFPFAVFALSSVIFIHLLEYWKMKIISLPVDNWLSPFVLFCLIWLVIVFSQKVFQPFVYAQF